MTTLGVLLTATSPAVFVWFITDFTIYESLLLSTIMSSSSEVVVFSIVRSKSLALKTNLRSIRELKSGSNDPMAYVLTIAFLILVINQVQCFLSIIPLFLQQMILGGIAGFAFGRLSKFVINSVKLGVEGFYPV